MASFVGTNILPIEVILDFILGGRHTVPIGPTCSRLRCYNRQSPSFRLHHCQSTVVTLVNILVKVFHSRDGATDLNIDVALVPHGQVRVVRDDPMVVKDKARVARGRGQQQEVVSDLGVPFSQVWLHPSFTSSCLRWSLGRLRIWKKWVSRADSDTDSYGQVHMTTTHLPNFQQLHLRGVGEGPAVVPSPVGWVATGGVFSLGLESLGITLAASPIHHARTWGM
jgi:hypothetical protein